ncbi:MAG: 4-(cytidine 5'-diphospho)-2-C-methyl-D-erythritol kinase [Janthinobacterium lividum]
MHDDTTNAPLTGAPAHRAAGDTRLRCAAPAKLNLFLHITGRRADGYHALQSVFQLIDYADTLTFSLREDGQLRRTLAIDGVAEQDDLCIRAARLLQQYAHCPLGVDITLDKVLPMGAGLGGGSSDAATTLLALNRLWQLSLPRATLQQLALSLGADVPFFVFGRNAFAEGVGESLSVIDLPSQVFLVVTPPVQVATHEIFAARELTRDTEAIKITDFLGAANIHAFGRNDMQHVVSSRYPEVAQVLDWFSEIAPARMTGSGASVFATFASHAEAEAVRQSLPSGWNAKVAASLHRHPLFDFAS